VSADSSLIRILTVDDHALLRKGIAALVNAEPDMKLIAEASTGVEAIKQFKQYRPDVTLMDLQMPDMGGIEAIIGIRNEFPDARIIVLTTYAGDVQVVRALEAGARAYLLKAKVNRDLLETVRWVHAGQKRIPPEVAAGLAEHTGEHELSAREIEVLRLIATGERKQGNRRSAFDWRGYRQTARDEHSRETESERPNPRGHYWAEARNH